MIAGLIFEVNMQYFISFLEGIITFVSPCLLPMLPIYISYFAGGKEKNTVMTVKNALGFILGFTTIFILTDFEKDLFKEVYNEIISKHNAPEIYTDILNYIIIEAKL